MTIPSNFWDAKSESDPAEGRLLGLYDRQAGVERQRFNDECKAAEKRVPAKPTRDDLAAHARAVEALGAEALARLDGLEKEIDSALDASQAAGRSEAQMILDKRVTPAYQAAAQQLEALVAREPVRLLESILRGERLLSTVERQVITDNMLAWCQAHGGLELHERAKTWMATNGDPAGQRLATLRARAGKVPTWALIAKQRLASGRIELARHCARAAAKARDAAR